VSIAHHSPRYAEATIQRILDRTDMSSRHPQDGEIVREFGAEDLRELLENPYRILYRILPEQIDIIAIIHAARIMSPDRPDVVK
jgi:plasmid stabilization system protein ParE